MTILEQVQAAAVGTVALDVEAVACGLNSWAVMKLDTGEWLHESGTRHSAEFVAEGSLAGRDRWLYLIPPDALAQFEVKE